MRLAEDEYDRSSIGHLHLGDPSIRVRVAAAEIGVHDPFKRCDHVFRIQWAAVAEAQTVSEADLESRRTRRGDRLCKVWDHIERPRVDRDERAEQKSRHAQAIGIAHEPRVELLRISREHHD